MKRLFSVLCVLALTVVIAHAADNPSAAARTAVGFCQYANAVRNVSAKPASSAVSSFK